MYSGTPRHWWNLSLYEDTLNWGHLSKQDTFSHPNYHSCMLFNLWNEDTSLTMTLSSDPLVSRLERFHWVYVHQYVCTYIDTYQMLLIQISRCFSNMVYVVMCCPALYRHLSPSQDKSWKRFANSPDSFPHSHSSCPCSIPPRPQSSPERVRVAAWTWRTRQRRRMEGQEGVGGAVNRDSFIHTQPTYYCTTCLPCPIRIKLCH